MAELGPVRLAHDSLLGLAVGDALGAGSEGHSLRAGPVRDLTPPTGVVLRWTDDTQMALSVVEVLQEAGEIDRDRLARAFARRYDAGRGYGAGMHILLSLLGEGRPWSEARHAVFADGSFGNGSAMRVAPLGAFLADQAAETVVDQAGRSAEVTHAHPEGVAGAQAIALAAWQAARSRGGEAPARALAFETVLAHLARESRVKEGVQTARQLSGATVLGEAVDALGNGSRVSCADTVPLVLWIAAGHMDDYAAAVQTAVAAGGDTDTLAAMVGGIVAARVSASGIPSRWREAVEPLPQMSDIESGQI
jgi:ADP-ribosylglycohydrolase